MSRNFISEETLIDRLLLDDTGAFEELYRRYCFPLFTYASGKLHSPDDAKKVIRDIFIKLWERRHSLPVDFSISFYLYTEVRKSVVRCIDERLLDQTGATSIEEKIIPGFAVLQLKKARQPVKKAQPDRSFQYALAPIKANYENQWWNKYQPVINLKRLRLAFQSISNFW